MTYDILNISDFKLLWELNPTIDANGNGFNESYQLARGIIASKLFTPDGLHVNIELLIERYKTHIHIKGLLNEGTEARFQKKENKIKSVYEYLSTNHFNIIDKLPENSRHYYFFGNNSNTDITIHFNKYKQLWRS